jgi:hypothetical protein
LALPSEAPPHPSSLQDISRFHQPSLSSEGSRSFEAPTPETNTDSIGGEPDHESSRSSGSSFDSKYSSSTIASAPSERRQPNPFCSIPQPIPDTDTQPPDTVIPEILSQDQTLIASWQRLFTKASRPPTHQEKETTTAKPQYYQEYLDNSDGRPNESFGDNMSEKFDGLCRLYFVNINGISSANDYLAFQDALESLLANEVDIFGMSETNLDWLKHDI